MSNNFPLGFVLALVLMAVLIATAGITGTSIHTSMQRDCDAHGYVRINGEWYHCEKEVGNE